MAALRLPSKRAVPYLILVLLVFAGVWIFPGDAPAPVPTGPAAALAGPVAQGEAEPAAKEYHTWQELAYLSVFFARLAHTYYGLEQTVRARKDGPILPPGPVDLENFWFDPDPCKPPICEWTVGELAECDSAASLRVNEIMDRAAQGIAVAERLLGPSGTFKFKFTKLYVPDEKWLEAYGED
jgi:hypothetical protein